ncbi:hypothetical protein DUNSADRAFT_13978 [Dunaliella salina]|uniref:KIF-binding protein n=1 Tax=Dunaliella salina TaxID=3046 RepID=A0ABQ7G890_DUNSA|nr:hypothetical protein DUNSADRAFT_13978 [Dunaliella salina]|eukprot:KAF5830830.1 hypothetical protein DUNSADRAFT_13978 [Dunaliella salina]
MKSFAQAVEIDELACSWKKNYLEKMEQMQLIGDFFELPSRNDAEKYYSMLTEAYLVVILYTVLSSYDKQEQDVAEDYKVVKSRMDVCVQLQKNNPMIYKLRADFCMRLGAVADEKLIQKDLETAIQMAEADEDGRTLSCPGVDPKQQRLFVLTWCHHQLGCLARKAMNLPRAKEHFELAIKYADPHYVGLAYCYFCLCIITLMSVKKAEPEERPGITLQAISIFQDGVAAEKRTLRYVPMIRDIELPRKLAKELIKRFTKGLPTAGDGF